MGCFLAALFLICQFVFLHYAHAAAAPSELIIGYAAMRTRRAARDRRRTGDSRQVRRELGASFHSRRAYLGCRPDFRGHTLRQRRLDEAASSTKPTRCKESVLNDGIGNN